MGFYFWPSILSIGMNMVSRYLKLHSSFDNKCEKCFFLHCVFKSFFPHGAFLERLEKSRCNQKSESIKLAFKKNIQFNLVQSKQTFWKLELRITFKRKMFFRVSDDIKTINELVYLEYDNLVHTTYDTYVILGTSSKGWLPSSILDKRIVDVVRKFFRKLYCILSCYSYVIDIVPYMPIAHVILQK